jgi:hypothetical protein
VQPYQGGKRRWFEFDALGLRLVKAASLLQCPFDAKKDPLVTKNTCQGARFRENEALLA